MLYQSKGCSLRNNISGGSDPLYQSLHVKNATVSLCPELASNLLWLHMNLMKHVHLTGCAVCSQFTSRLSRDFIDLGIDGRSTALQVSERLKWMKQLSEYLSWFDEELPVYIWFGRLRNWRGDPNKSKNPWSNKKERKTRKTNCVLFFSISSSLALTCPHYTGSHNNGSV